MSKRTLKHEASYQNHTCLSVECRKICQPYYTIFLSPNKAETTSKAPGVPGPPYFGHKGLVSRLNASGRVDAQPIEEGAYKPFQGNLKPAPGI